MSTSKLTLEEVMAAADRLSEIGAILGTMTLGVTPMDRSDGKGELMDEADALKDKIKHLTKMTPLAEFYWPAYDAAAEKAIFLKEIQNA